MQEILELIVRLGWDEWSIFIVYYQFYKDHNEEGWILKKLCVVMQYIK